MKPPVKRRAWFGLIAGIALLLPACTSDGQLCILGYTSRPNFDPGIRTVYVPIFKNLSFRRGVEFDLTRAVIREIESKTPFKVVADANRADTELLGTIVTLNKNTLNVNPQNEVRDSETLLTVQIVWRDLRPDHRGEILSQPKPPAGAPKAPPVPANVPLPPAPPTAGNSLANFIPELGESLTTATKKNVDRMAKQIVQLMEMPW